MENFNFENDLFFTHSAWGDFSQDKGLVIEFCDYSNGVVTCHIQ